MVPFRRRSCHALLELPSEFRPACTAFVTSSESDDLLIADLIDLPLAEREGYLSRTCGHDPVKRDRLVGKLGKLMESLAADSGSVSPASSRSSSSEIAQALATGLDLHEKPGTKIGRYTLLQKIGEGGCGIVYLAEQEQPVRRQVALKLIKLGLDTREFVARFEAERQALALMEHPGIARVFDAGATELGRPYFVMELVRGVPITRFCDQAKLPLRDRLWLFIAVCQAVQHAHQKGVIHRDLKPSNILVAQHDGLPVPKIIDFGIAKAMDAEPTDKTLFTQFHAFVGTPAYTSPEQMESGGADIDTRTDIYSLGVLLYELLTGRTPFDSQELARTGLDAMRKTIRETEPPRPSVRLHSTREGELKEIATRRGTEPTKLIHLVQGDLDWIVMKCLEKDRDRRYETANGLAADIERHLSDEPVTARPPSNAYRIRKLVARHRVAFGAATAVLVALVLGLVIASVALVRARAARERALVAEQGETVLRRQAEQAKTEESRRVTRTSIDLAEQFFSQGRVPDGLAYLVRAGRKDPHNALVASRLLSALTSRDFYLPEGPPLRFPSAAKGASFTPDGSEIFVDCDDGMIHVLDAATGQLKREFRCEQKLGPPPAFRLSLAFAANNDAIFAVRFVDGRYVVCDRATGKLRTPIISPPEPAVNGPYLSPDGRWLAVASLSTAWLYDAATGGLVATMPHGKGATIPGQPVFSPDSRHLAISSWDPNVTRIWSVPDGTPSIPPLVSENRKNWRVAFGPDGQMIAVGSENGVQLYQANSGEKTGPYLLHDDLVWSVGFTQDGRRLIATSLDGTTKIRDIHTGALVRSLSIGGVMADAKLSADGTKLFAERDPGIGQLCDLETGACLASTAFHEVGANGAFCSPDLQQLALCLANGEMYRFRRTVGGARSFDLSWGATYRGLDFVAKKSGQLVCLTADRARALDVTSAGELSGGIAYPEPGLTVIKPRADQRAFIARTATTKWIGCLIDEAGVSHAVPLPDLDGDVVFSAIGDLVAVLHPDSSFRPHASKRVDFFSLRTGEPAGRPIVSDVPLQGGTATFDPTGQRFVINTETSPPYGGGTIRMMDVATGELLKEVRLSANIPVWLVSLSPDGQHLAAGNVYGEAKIWDVATGRAITGAIRQGGAVSCGEFSPDGRTCAIGDWGGTVRIWDSVTGQRVGVPLIHPTRVDAVRFSKDGSRIVTASHDGMIRIWDAATGLPVTESMADDSPALDVSFDGSGSFVLVKAYNGRRIWSVPPTYGDATVPEWLLQLATICAGQRLNDDGQFVGAWDEIAKLDDVRRALAHLPDDAPYVEWGRWFLADPATRSIAPGFRLKPEQIKALDAELTRASADK